jgi:hypothetical protein
MWNLAACGRTGRLRGCQGRKCGASNNVDVNKESSSLPLGCPLEQREAEMIENRLCLCASAFSRSSTLRSSILDENFPSVGPEASCSRARWRHANTEQYCTERCSLEDALVLLGLEARTVRLFGNAKECTACDQQPRAKEKFVSVLGRNVFRYLVGHFLAIIQS